MCRVYGGGAYIGARVFASLNQQSNILGGERLVWKRSIWRQFPKVRSARCSRSARARASPGDWYECFAEHMELAPLDFAMSYITRSGRVELERLLRVSPRFVAAYQAWRRRP